MQTQLKHTSISYLSKYIKTVFKVLSKLYKSLTYIIHRTVPEQTSVSDRLVKQSITSSVSVSVSVYSWSI